MQFLPHRKDPLVTTVCLSARSLDVTKMSLRLSVRRKATRGVVWKTLLHLGEDERILKCCCMIVDRERRAGLYVITRGTRLGWLVVIWLGLSVSLRAIAWTRWISFLRKETSYPRLLRYWMSSLACKVKLSSEENMRRNRRARLNGMARLVCSGCIGVCL